MLWVRGTKTINQAPNNLALNSCNGFFGKGGMAMKDKLPPRTLRMFVLHAWLVDSITTLGSRYITHLSYRTEDIDPEVLGDIRGEHMEAGLLGEIIYKTAQPSRRVAVVEVLKANDYHHFIRFDFRILKVNPSLRDGIILQSMPYECYYQKNPG
jgi:hypothetical protein